MVLNLLRDGCRSTMTAGHNARRIRMTADVTDQLRTENPAGGMASGIIGLRAITPAYRANAADAEQDGMISSRHL